MFTTHSVYLYMYIIPKRIAKYVYLTSVDSTIRIRDTHVLPGVLFDSGYSKT